MFQRCLSSNHWEIIWRPKSCISIWWINVLNNLSGVSCSPSGSGYFGPWAQHWKERSFVSAFMPAGTYQFFMFTSLLERLNSYAVKPVCSNSALFFILILSLALKNFYSSRLENSSHSHSSRSLLWTHHSLGVFSPSPCLSASQQYLCSQSRVYTTQSLHLLKCRSANANHSVLQNKGAKYFRCSFLPLSFFGSASCMCFL